MPRPTMDGVIQQIRHLAEGSRGSLVTDQQLLERFIGRRDEAAFAALVRRHGPMILGLCRRLLQHVQDAEDVFQASFLVLARKAAAIRKQESVGSWLYGVAYRLALKTKAEAARKQRRSRIEDRGSRKSLLRSSILDPRSSGLDPLAEISWREVCTALDEELARLPDRCRAPLVLCYLESKTQDEALHQLGWSKSTFRRRLEEGRKRLCSRLTRRGITLSAGLWATLLSDQGASAALPSALSLSTVQAAIPFAAGEMAGCGTGVTPVSPQVTLLVKEGLKAAVMSKMKWVALVGMVTAVTTGMGLAARQALTANEAADEPRRLLALADEQRDPPPAPSPTGGGREGSGKANQTRVDRYGDPLPEGAVARLGTVRLRGAGSPGMAFSPDGKMLATGGMSIHVWDLATGKELLQFAAPQVVHDLIHTADGKALVGAEGPEGKVHVWDAATGKELRQLAGLKYGFQRQGNGRREAVLALGYVRKDLLMFAGSGTDIRVWNLDTGKEVRTLAGHAGTVDQVVLSGDGKRLASVGFDGTVRVWDATTGKELLVFKRGSWCLGISHDGRMIMTSEASARLWDTATGKEICQLQGQPGRLISAIFKRDGKTLITGGFDHTVRYWDTGTGKELRRLETPVVDVFNYYRLALSPDEKVLAAVGYEPKIFLWNTETGKPIDHQQGHEAQVSSLAYSPDGKTLATGGHDGTVRIWDLRTGKQTRAFEPVEPRQDPIWLDRIEFSSLGKLLVSESYAALFVSVWDPVAGKELYRRKARYSTFSPDGKLLASAEWDADARDPYQRAVIRLYEAETGKLIREMRGHHNQIAALAFLPDGKTLASQSASYAENFGGVVSYGDAGIIRYWDVASGRQIRHSDKYLPWGTHSPDGRTVAWPDPTWPAGDWIPSGLREFASGQTRATFSTRGDSYIFLPPLAFSPDGRMLASVDHSGAIRLWELPSCKQIGLLDRHRGGVVSLAFAPDGKSLASGRWDTTVLIWDVTPYRRKTEQVRLESHKLQALWRDLESNAETAYRALAELARSPKQAIGLMEEHLHPAPALDPKELNRLISDLDRNQFEVRAKASAALERMGTTVGPALREALAAKPSAEARHRIDALMEKIQARIPPLKELREIRAVEILEYLAAPGAEPTGFTTGAPTTRLAAIALLKKLAAGAPEARLTQEAKASLQRLNKRSTPSP